MSVDLDGKQHYLDSQLSYERACHHAIDYLMKFGYSDIQAYMILGSAPIEGRFSGVVDIPNSCATVYLPTAIFDFDVNPSSAETAQGQAGHPGPDGGELRASEAPRMGAACPWCAAPMPGPSTSPRSIEGGSSDDVRVPM